MVMVAHYSFAISIDSIYHAGLMVMNIETIDHEEPTCDYIKQSEDGPTSITNATKVPGRLRLFRDNEIVYDSGDYEDDVSGMTIKIRGNTSAHLAKKSYKVKLQKKADLLMRNNKKYNEKEWVLIHDKNDDGHNAINSLIGFQINRLVGMQWTPECQYVNVVINGTYRGCYLLTESVKRNTDCRINISKSGYIIEHDPYSWNEPVSFKTRRGMTYHDYTFKYPDADDITEEQIEYIKGVVDDFELALYYCDYHDYIDVTSFANWLLAHDILGTWDASGSNVYLTKYDDTPDSKLMMGNLWDFDTNGMMVDDWARIHNQAFYFRYLFENNNHTFRNTYLRRWDEIKGSIFDDMASFLDSLRCSTYAANIQKSRVFDNELYGYAQTTVYEDIEKAEEWFSSRRVWLQKAISEQIADGADEEMPKICLYGYVGNDFLGGKATVIMPDDSIESRLSLKMKWYGEPCADSNEDSKHSYMLRFLDSKDAAMERSLLGLRSHSDWLLDAASVDMSRVRNRVANDIWNDFAHKPYYSDKEPEALSAAQGKFVEMYLNEEYMGIYCLTEFIDSREMRLREYDEQTPLIHGQLWKGADSVYTDMCSYGDFDIRSASWGGFETVYPVSANDTTFNYNAIYNAVRFVADSDNRSFNAKVADFFDLPVLVDYYLLLTVLNGIDNASGKNIYWACYDSHADMKLTPALWKWDACAGQNIDNEDYRPATVAPLNNIDDVLSLRLLSRLRENNTDNFNEKVCQRYKELRSTLFSPYRLVQRFNEYIEMFKACGAAEREAERWNGDSHLAGRELNFTEEQQYIKSWIESRIAYLDKNLVNSSILDLNAESKKGNGDVYNLQGMRIGNTNSVFGGLTNHGFGGLTSRGVVIRNGKAFTISAQ